ncbi:MAG: DUF58 domain-containing protein, partial [Planctomycetota bacterium]
MGDRQASPPSAINAGLALADQVATLAIEANRLAGALRAGQHPAAGAGDAHEFDDHRPWSPGDGVRGIDWRLSGRTNRLYTRQTARLGAMHLDLRLDASASMNFAGLSDSDDEAAVKPDRAGSGG